MKNNLGIKIKAIRRELGLTQEVLASPAMTKGMISHIEKGISYPSMKNLQHIAKKLNKPLAFFLEDNYVSNNITNDSIVDEILEKLRTVDRTIKDKEYVIANHIVDNILQNNSINLESKLYADIMFRKAQALLALSDFEKGEEAVRNAYNTYLKLQLFCDAARIYLRLIERPYSMFDYEECIRINKKSRGMYKKGSSFGEIVEIELDTYMIGVYAGFGDIQEAKACCMRIMDICKNNNIYYNIDAAFNYSAIISLIEGDIKKFAYYIQKVTQLYELCERKDAYSMTLLKHAFYKNEIHEPNEALIYLNEFKQKSSILYFNYYLEECKAYYKLGLYDTALDSAKKIDYNIEGLGCLDIVYIWSAKVYEGLIYFNKGDISNAIVNINTAVQKLKLFLNHKNKLYAIYAKQLLNFACESMGEIYSSINDYKNAFKYISIANEMNKIS